MLKKLKQYQDQNSFVEVYKIMADSFPLDEYRPFKEQKNLLANDSYNIYVLTDESKQKVKAFIAVWLFNEFAFIEHFAVDAKHRSGGIGSQILQEVVHLLKCTILLEVEHPKNDMSKKRIEFYMRNGFFLNEYPYVQPAISMGRKEIPLLIMSYGKEITLGEFENYKSVIYKNVYRV